MASMPFSLTGKLLVAGRLVRHNVFRRAVVLVLYERRDGNKSNGYVGVVINKPTGHCAECGRTVELPLFTGGPVEVSGTLLLHDRRDMGRPAGKDECPVDGLYYGDEAQLRRLLDAGVSGHSHYKLIVNCAAWAPGRLEKEIADGRWDLHDATPGLVLGDHEHVWSVLVPSPYASPSRN